MDNPREKLIELLRDVQYLGGLEEKIADHLIANGVTLGSKWIPVTERLPDVASKHKHGRSRYTKSIRVLCVCVQKDGKTMVKEGYYEFWNDYPEPCWKIPGTIDAVTHWMPLPEPPTE